jgi:hypothetical protein
MRSFRGAQPALNDLPEQMRGARPADPLRNRSRSPT